MITVEQERERVREIFQLPRYSYNGIPIIEDIDIPEGEIRFYSWDKEQMKFRLTKLINIGN